MSPQIPNEIIISSGVSQLPNTLADVIAGADKMEASSATGAPTYRLGFIRNITIEGISPYLRYRFLEDGVSPLINYGGFGTLKQDLLSPDSPLKENISDLIITALMLEELDPDFGLPQWTANRALEVLNDFFSDLEESDHPLIALNTFPLPSYTAAGSGTSTNTNQIVDEIDRLNRFIYDWVNNRKARFCLIDWCLISRRIGESNSMDYRYWYLSKAPFKGAFLDQMALAIRAIMRSMVGLTKKCLVLDCDNTLWGGIIGEDGLAGIKLDRHEYPGKIYYDFQKTVLQLIESGVLVMLCSKNNEKEVFNVLANHPWCLLKREHLSAHRVNWVDKASNLTSLSKELNLGLNSFAFVDDNPRELDLIKQLLPDVTVLQVPTKLYQYPNLLVRDALFDTTVVVGEDKLRTKLYQVEAIRKTEQQKYTDLRSYLASLNQIVKVHIVSDDEISRVAQLTQKTNQFNLTTHRYTDYEIRQLAGDSASCVYTLTAEDRFGALGLVGVFIARLQGEIVMVDNILMSCRALGRGLEVSFVLECMRDIGDKWLVSGWESVYIPTSKNSQVAGFWESIGFALMSDNAGVLRFKLPQKQTDVHAPNYITVNNN